MVLDSIHPMCIESNEPVKLNPKKKGDQNHLNHSDTRMNMKCRECSSIYLPLCLSWKFAFLPDDTSTNFMEIMAAQHVDTIFVATKSLFRRRKNARRKYQEFDQKSNISFLHSAKLCMLFSYRRNSYLI